MPKEKQKVSNNRNRAEIYTEAMEMIKKGMSIRRCSMLLNIPRSTLSDKYHGYTAINASKGSPSVLNASEESRLEEWLLERSETGFPITKDQLLDSVKLLMLQWKRNNPFVDNRPGRRWYEAFLRRHPQLTETGAQSLTTANAEIPPRKLTERLESVAKHLSEKLLLNIDASRYYNIDETCFLLNPTDSGRKNPNSKEFVSCIFMISANGVVAPPMLVFPYKRIPTSIDKSVPPTWHVRPSESGQVTPELFLDYIKNKFHVWLVAENRQFPVVLFFNGQSAHFTLPLAEFCKENNIELVPLYFNVKQTLLPIHSALIQPLQDVWPQTVDNWRCENGGAKLKREAFATLLKQAFESLDVEASIEIAFKSCGMHPFVLENVGFHFLNDQKGSLNVATDQKEDLDVAIDQKEDLDVGTERLQAGRRLKMVLNVVEENLSPDLLREFKKSRFKGVWSGELKNLGLFEFWLVMSRKTEEIDDGDEYNNELVLQQDPGSVSDCASVHCETPTEKRELLNGKMDILEDESDKSSDDDKFEESKPPLHAVKEPKTS